MIVFLLQAAWLIPFYPLVAAVASLAWSPGLISRTGPRPCGYLNLLMVAVAFGHSLVALTALHTNAAAGAQALYRPISFGWTWLNSGGLRIGFDGLVTEPALIAMAVITGLHLLVQIYAIGYMEMDWGWPRFFGSLSFFEAGLCALVLTDSVFFSYVILELLTLGTYLIVGTWYNQPLVVKGARDAFLTKRIGDLILLAGVIALLPVSGTWNFHGLQGWAADLTNNGTPLPPGFQLILLALIAGPMGKCAQIPLHLWLDEAMESPLPSTVLRNSVVVVGGAWVLLRLEPLLELSPFVQAVLVVVGGSTAVVASLIALAQVDVKRALSFLVSSWLGLLFVAVGLGGTAVADHLLLVYPLPMALLLMAIGTIVISNVTQDLTQLGGLWSKRPLIGICLPRRRGRPDGLAAVRQLRRPARIARPHGGEWPSRAAGGRGAGHQRPDQRRLDPGFRPDLGRSTHPVHHPFSGGALVDGAAHHGAGGHGAASPHAPGGQWGLFPHPPRRLGASGLAPDRLHPGGRKPLRRLLPAPPRPGPAAGLPRQACRIGSPTTCRPSASTTAPWWPWCWPWPASGPGATVAWWMASAAAPVPWPWREPGASASRPPVAPRPMPSPWCSGCC